MCAADPCRFLSSTCPAPMPRNATCHDNSYGDAVSTRSGRPVAICGAVWVDEAADREVCGTFDDEPYKLIRYEHHELYVKYWALYAAYSGKGKHGVWGGAKWVGAGAASGLLLLVVVGLVAVCLRGRRRNTRRKHLALLA